MHTPAVAIRVSEKDAPDVVEGLSFPGRTVRTGVEHLYLADLHASFDQFRAGSDDVRDDEKNAVNGAGFHAHPRLREVNGAC